MIVMRYRKPALGTAITACDSALPYSLEAQNASIASFLGNVDRVLVFGKDTPTVKGDGLRHVLTPPNPAIVQMLGNYMQTIPGNEAVLIVAPNVIFDKAQSDAVMEEVAKARLDLAWCSSVADGLGLIMSAPVVAHLMNDIPSGLTFHNQWQAYISQWAKGIMRHRFIDTSKFSMVTPIEEVLPPAPVLAPAAPTQAHSVRRRKA